VLQPFAACFTSSQKLNQPQVMQWPAGVPPVGNFLHIMQHLSPDSDNASYVWAGMWSTLHMACCHQCFGILCTLSYNIAGFAAAFCCCILLLVLLAAA
jgi:hypothetical protein